jgi:hypothetical protein
MPEDLIEGLEESVDYFDQRPRLRNRFYEDSEEYRPAPVFQTKRVTEPEESPIRPKTIAELKAYIEEKERRGFSGTAAEAPKSGRLIKAGARVRHEQFGDGIVLSRERSGNDFRLVVTFSLVGKKTLLESFAKLKVL